MTAEGEWLRARDHSPKLSGGRGFETLCLFCIHIFFIVRVGPECSGCSGYNGKPVARNLNYFELDLLI